MSIPYPYKKELGEGSYGVTYLIDYNGQEAVLKWPHNRNTLFRKEAETMKKLHCRYCVHIIDIVKYNGRTGIVMEYCPHKSLEDVLNKFREKNKKLSKRGILKLFCEMVLGLKYLHDHKVLHLDLKPENIFITNDNMCILGDFGLSTEVEDINISLNDRTGTPIYNAPEQLGDRPSYHSSADIYALGLILYEICTLKSFYDGAKVMNDLFRMNEELKDASTNPKNVFYTRRMNIIPKHIPEELKKIIINCLSYNPTDRPTINDIYHEEIIQNYIENGIQDFLNDYDSIEDETLTRKWNEILDICKNNQIYDVSKKKDIIISLFDHYKKTELMLEEEKLNMWKLIRLVSRLIGYQLLLDPHVPDSKIKYYKTEEYEDLKGSYDNLVVSVIFPKMLEYLCAHKYNDEADAILEVILEEEFEDEMKQNSKNVCEKYKR